MQMEELAVSVRSKRVEQPLASSVCTVTIGEEGGCGSVRENTVYISVSEKQQRG